MLLSRALLIFSFECVLCRKIVKNDDEAEDKQCSAICGKAEEMKHGQKVSI